MKTRTHARTDSHTNAHHTHTHTHTHTPRAAYSAPLQAARIRRAAVSAIRCLKLIRCSAERNVDTTSPATQSPQCPPPTVAITRFAGRLFLEAGRGIDSSQTVHVHAYTRIRTPPEMRATTGARKFALVLPVIPFVVALVFHVVPIFGESNLIGQSTRRK